MKVKDIIETVDKSKENYCWPDIEDFMSELDVSSYGSADYNKFQSRVSGYWFVSWVCTDTRVGGRVYFMDDQPVAISYQEGRKCDEVFEFISVESAQKVRDFVLHCCDDGYSPNIADLNRDINIDQIMKYHAV
jgi:hypothetical protein